MMPNTDQMLDAILYLQLLKQTVQLYYMELQPCCRRAFREADNARDGDGPDYFTCVIHGYRDVNIDLAGKIIGEKGAQRYHIMQCLACSQKNRVDMARVLATGNRPVCGKCKMPLQGVRN
jgi:hypothetical protein